MNDVNRKIIYERIREAGKTLEGKLPDSDRHPKGRNPYAHIAKVIKSLTGMSYKDIPDQRLPVVLEIIRYCESNPF